MSKPPLGHLERVAPRSYWADEALHFTPWLADEENIALLGDAIGVELEVQDQEVRVGPFRADILCRNTLTEELVLIENQLERTDHAHLGQLFTYAAGLDAVTVIWIAERFTEEHRAALDWLNRITHETFRFFGIEIELWRIGGSALAPKFSLVAKPNEWSKSVREAATQRGQLSETQELQVAYWQAFGEYAAERQSKYLVPRPPARNYIDYPLGRSDIHMGARVQMVYNDEAVATVYLYIKGEHSTGYLRLLERGREEIERELGFPVRWNEKPDMKHSIVEVIRGGDPTRPETWEDFHAWTLRHLEAFERVFKPRIRNLKPADATALETATEA